MYIMVKKLCIGVCILLMSAGLCAENNYENDINILKQHLMSENHGVVLREITHCNYSKYEAESAIRKWDNIQQFPSNFLYEIDRDVGEKNTDQYASHLYVWECLESVDNAGYASERLYWKWTDNNQYPKDQIMFMHQDTLFYDFVMRIDDDFAYADTTTICDVNVFVIDESNN